MGEYETIDDWDHSYDDPPRHYGVYKQRYNRGEEVRAMRTARTRAPESEDMSEETDTTVTHTRTARTSRAGFDAYNKTVATLNQITFQVKDDSEVIVFLDPANFSFELRHWIKYIGEDNKPATRAEWCLGADDEGASVCPLCDIGDTPKPVAFFNVVNLANPTKVLVWEASADPKKAIEREYNKLKKKNQTLDNDDLYWIISKEKASNGYYTFSVDRMTEEELRAAWPGLKPLTKVQREALRSRKYDEDYIDYKTYEELREFADSLG